MNVIQKNWYRVGEVWLILFLLTATIIGSFGLAFSAVHHPDPLLPTPQAIASPLPPASNVSTAAADND